MILLNSCNSVKVQYNDSEPKKLFSIVALNKEDAPELRLIDDILVDETTASFLREFAFEWLESEDKDQIYGVRVEADKETCREFLRDQLASNREILLDDE
jgi:hypothetical protein